jgi:hypothetical protein
VSDETSEERTIIMEDCELCVAARFTEWFHEDEQCWIAECESCSVPMVVWRVHDPQPPPEIKAALHAKLLAVVAAHFDGDVRIDDDLRTIRDHYHAHARPREWGRHLRRRGEFGSSRRPPAR